MTTQPAVEAVVGVLARLGEDPEAIGFQPMRGKGCRRCVGTGYMGRVGVYEFFELNEKYAEMVVKLESAESIRALARQEGMTFLVDDGVAKIQSGLTTVEEVARVDGRRGCVPLDRVQKCLVPDAGDGVAAAVSRLAVVLNVGDL